MKNTTRLIVMAFSVVVLAVAAPKQAEADWDCHACASTCDALLGQMACEEDCPDYYVAKYCMDDDYEYCDLGVKIITCVEPQPD